MSDAPKKADWKASALSALKRLRPGSRRDPPVPTLEEVLAQLCASQPAPPPSTCPSDPAALFELHSSLASLAAAHDTMADYLARDKKVTLDTSVGVLRLFCRVADSTEANDLCRLLAKVDQEETNSIVWGLGKCLESANQAIVDLEAQQAQQAQQAQLAQQAQQ